MTKTVKNRDSIEHTQHHSWMKYICHQRPDRCFKFHGKPMPICARCFGFYLGLLIGILIPLFIFEIYFINVNYMLILMILCIIPLAIDGLTQFLGFRNSNNYLRFSTGILAGVFLGIVFNWLIVNLVFL